VQMRMAAAEQQQPARPHRRGRGLRYGSSATPVT
jgi:hypothetical protein